MIIVKLSGGLGNQLFQYSFGKCLSFKLSSELKFDIQTINSSHSFTNRRLGLDYFNINLNIACKKEIEKFKYFHYPILERFERKLVQKFPILNKNYYVEDINTYSISPNTFRDNCYYDGYWQSEHFFRDIKYQIRQELILSKQLDSNNELLVALIDNQYSVSIHVRRNDYIRIKSNRKVFAECSLKYYLEAIEYIQKRNANIVFYVFSDDINWVKSHLIGAEFVFVENNEDRPEIDMYLMSRCKSNIIANSTFSWWAAWLNINPNKIVIAPNRWFLGKRNDALNYIIPQEWVLI